MGGRCRKLLAVGCWVLAVSGCGAQKQGRVTPELLAQGGKLFALYCSGCHPAGENRLYPQKSLHCMELRANGITTADDIVAVIRNPGRGMKRYDQHTLPDAAAWAIAQYVLATF